MSEGVRRAGQVCALVWSLAATGVAAAGDGENFWVFLRDKVDARGRHLAWEEGAAGRAERDLPVYAGYVDQVRAQGAQVRAQSRWFNAISVRATPAVRARLRALDCVRRLERVRRFRRPEPSLSPPLPAARRAQDEHGLAFAQLAQVGVIALHRRGIAGAGVRIAVIDNGFHYAQHPAFARGLKVVAQRDFINGDDVVGDEKGQPVTGDETRSAQNLHGTQVLSVLAAYDPGRFVGVAPEAEYILAKTEDNATELPIEEDRWIAGLEWADSLGADVVNSSLGYNIWDEGDSYEYADLDGETALSSRAAALAVERGIVVVAAAGNEADGPWHYVTAPADARGVIAVGSVDVPASAERLPQIASSSSRGPTADGRIKPDVVAPGQGVVVADVRGHSYLRSSGTSFAAPVVSGICALLLQVHPDWSPAQVLEALRATALDLGAAGPDTVYGWGQVDALAASGLRRDPPPTSAARAPYPNPARGAVVHFPVQLGARQQVELSIFDAAGRLVFRRSWDLLAGVHEQAGAAPQWSVPQGAANGVYFYRLRSQSLERTGALALVRP